MSIFKKRQVEKPVTWITPEAEYYEISNAALETEHTLIAGAAGCGKSTFLHSVMAAALAQYSPSEVRFILIDPKSVELMRYEHLPHTLRYTDTESGAVDALAYAERIMERRYDKMKQLNKTMWTTEFGPKVYVVVEELADLLTCPSKAKIKVQIQRIAQKGRAAAIHVIMATQAPSRKIIPAEITLNISGRFALACETAIESKQVIGIAGAEDLPDHGECYFKYRRRIERCALPYMSEDEVMKLVRYWQSDACRVA